MKSLSQNWEVIKSVAVKGLLLFLLFYLHIWQKGIDNFISPG